MGLNHSPKHVMIWWSWLSKVKICQWQLFPGSYFGIGSVLKIPTERRGQQFAWLSLKINWWVCVALLSTFLLAVVFLIGLLQPAERSRQSLKNAKLSGQQNITSNNFPDKARKLFFLTKMRHKCLNSFCDINVPKVRAMLDHWYPNIFMVSLGPAWVT